VGSSSGTADDPLTPGSFTNEHFLSAVAMVAKPNLCEDRGEQTR
jgi:hypothetical protein